jgi:1-acyl-sn-glycerol-3-phosphate acyltransferase
MLPAMAEPTAAAEFQKPRLVNRMFYRIMTGILRGIIVNYFQLTPVNPGVVPKNGAALILANHQCLFDPIWIYAMLRRPVYFAASEDLFRKRLLAPLIRWFGAFPKRKAASDVAALRSIFTIAGNGGLIGVFPEGVRTWDGRNVPLNTAIARLIRKLHIPVFICRLEGAYFAYPRWARRWRRIPVRGVFSRLYGPDEIPREDARILADISREIRTPDYDLDIDPRRHRQKGLAVNVTRVLYRCPSCGTMEGLKLVRPFSTNSVECHSCFSSWTMGVTCRLSPADENGVSEDKWTALPDYYTRIKAMPLAPIRTELRLGLEDGERLLMISRPRFLFKQEVFPNLRVFAFGRLFLTDRRLIFRTRIGIPLAAPVRGIGALSIDPGDKMHFTYEGKLYRIPFRNESALKWYDTIQRAQAGTL